MQPIGIRRAELKLLQETYQAVLRVEQALELAFVHLDCQIDLAGFGGPGAQVIEPIL